MKLKRYIHALVMLAVLAAAGSAYAAWYGRVGKESADALALAGQIQQRTQGQARAEQAKGALEKAVAEESAIRGYFVNTSDVVSFLESLQSTGAARGAKVEVVSVSSEPAKPHAVIVLALRVTGTFDSVLRTLGAIEYQPYDTALTNVTLDTSTANGAVPQWQAAATVSIGTSDVAAATTTKP